ncbi:T6SS immunity protein Tdi1 domain-containing protein [Vibrio sonorensis]|uniref:T6SS immunity protein Tdi1 domain-containing protein n=1 Tax=Vibrio sonorensis TaxID=1004316 RepID=UPI0008DB1F30|nr:T6SS immunity protein Tdi1 domain-containing protein [Vibrio sonorensis]
MKHKYYVVFSVPEPVSELGIWASQSGAYDLVLGYSFFGDLFLMNSVNKQLAILYVMPPELSEMQFFGINSFKSDCLTHEIIREDVLRESKVDVLRDSIGELAEGQVYIPQPYPFLGGNYEVENYSKGDLVTFLSIIGELQLT